MTREKAIKLLRAMAENTYSVSKIHKESGNTVFSKATAHEAIALDKAILILTDDKYANNLWKIFFKDEAIT